MSDLKFSVDVLCNRPPWSRLSKDPAYSDVRYRLYVNDDLITERTWIWPNNYQLREIFWINNVSTTYQVRLEPIIRIPNQAEFSLKNLVVSNHRYNTTHVEEQLISITLV